MARLRLSESNNTGQVAGWCDKSVISNQATHSFLYDNGTMTDLGTLLGFSYFRAGGINDSAQVVGKAQQSVSSSSVTHAFLYSDGAMQDLGTLGGDYSEARPPCHKRQWAGGRLL